MRMLKLIILPGRALFIGLCEISIVSSILRVMTNNFLINKRTQQIYNLSAYHEWNYRDGTLKPIS